MLRALFAPLARESLEMGYQYTAPHIFDSSLIESTFGLAPTPYREGIPAALTHQEADARRRRWNLESQTEALSSDDGCRGRVGTVIVSSALWIADPLSYTVRRF